MRGGSKTGGRVNKEEAMTLAGWWEGGRRNRTGLACCGTGNKGREWAPEALHSL